MLYVTTQDKKDAHTAYRTLGSNFGPDGGLFVPFKMPKMEPEQISRLKKKSFEQNISDVLNLLFKARLDGWDVGFTIGRHPHKLVPMSHRIYVAEVWHNPDYDFARIVRNLSSRIRGTEDTTDQPSNWAWIAIRIASLFALFGEMCKINVTDAAHPIDVALPTGDFAAPMAAWYAREMGLPIANIICSCDENDGSWELLRNGQINPAAGLSMPYDLERLIHGTLGTEETLRYVGCVKDKRLYQVTQEQLQKLNAGMFPAVISWNRREKIIHGVYSTSTYILDPGSAMAYGGLQDYRATAGESRPALILTERSPILSADTVAKAMNISVETLRERLNLT